MAGAKKTITTSYASDINRLCLFEEFVRSSYLPYVQQNKRSWKTDERYLNRHILPYLGNCALTEISEKKLGKWLSSLEANGLAASSRYRLFWLVKYILNFAVRVGALKSDAAFQNMVVRKNKQQRAPGILTPAEALKLVHLLEEYADRPSAQAIHLLLLTGASKSEILYARWQDVHLRRAVLATKMTYTGQSRLIPLNTEAIRLIRRLPRRKEVPWLFTSSSGQRLTSVFYTWNLLRTRLGRPELRIQDLRHCFANFLMEMGIPQPELCNFMGNYQSNIVKSFN
ncbi:site-specific integrase [uncultured Mailhella sp.]|uniref:tyrosine-type recombinase/integrase n=1 Tax=uncultured Mailhella sp. TaxID=1981031 RepID=UPI0025D3E479|nr:site-specific integrase [uncultured Mailhella sp.]